VNGTIVAARSPIWAEDFDVLIGKNYINGEWRDSSSNQTFEHRDPADLTQITGVFASSSPEDVNDAITAAHAAFPAWRGVSPQARKILLSAALDRVASRRDEVAKTITRESGKSLREANVEIESAMKEMDFQIAEGVRMFGHTVPVETPGTLAYTTREPRGPVGIITPWNFPFNVPCRKCIPALMAGNTVVFKPASLTPRVGLLFTEILADAGLPAGVFNCLTGHGRSVGEAIVRDPRVKAISFTGSTSVGKSIQALAAQNLTPTQLELGGKNPAIVLPDADLEFAADKICEAAFACSGQWCTATSRVIVVGDVAAKLTEHLAAKIQSIAVRHGSAPDCGMGPVCGSQQKADIARYIDVGKSEGARLLAGGEVLTGDGYANGCFIAPTLFDRVRPNMTIAREEIFGPVLVVIAVANFDEAIEVANDTPYGLSSSIFTNDLRRALTYMERSEVGLGHVNLMSALKEPQLPFGGVKESGAGIPEAGSSGIEFFTQHKVCYVGYR
jgi:aldehyde dehydrogenase (NAD+)